jgi:hypothetical protein
MCDQKGPGVGLVAPGQSGENTRAAASFGSQPTTYGYAALLSFAHAGL